MKTKSQPLISPKFSNTFKKSMRAFSMVLLISFYTSGQTISSVAELAAAAANSNQTITMTPGVYQMQDYLTPAVIAATVPDANNRHAMILFSGSNNTFDLTGVTIEINSALLNDYGTRIIEFYITGNYVNIKGLTVTDIGNSAPSSPGMQSVTVAGENNTMEDVTLNVNGSYPYGYGDLLGKGSGNLVTLRKHSGLLVEGLDINIIRCSIYSQAFGHLFFIQGGRNVLFQDCYAEAVTRTTDAMLAETSGPAFSVNFASVYSNYDGDKVITPGYTKSLSEVGYRSYGSGGIGGFTTGAITLINCEAKDTRSGFAFTRYGGDVLMQNCKATGCEAGYQVEEVTIENSRGDAVNGPLLYLNGGPSNVELFLIPNVATTTLHAIATVAGDNHNVTIKNYNDVVRPQIHSILLGVSRPSAANPFSPLGTASTSGTTLNNCTEMPIEIIATVSSCVVNTTGAVTNNGGLGNTVNTDSCVDIGDQTFNDGTYTYSVLGTSPNECQVTGFVSGQETATAVIPGVANNDSTPYSVVAIADGAFQNNTTISDVTLPSTVITIGTDAFHSCIGLTTINLDNIITYGSNSFNSCTALTLEPLNFTNTVSVGSYCFINCSSITSVVVPGTLTLGVGALRGTGISSFSIPSEWKVLPDQMIRDCKSITVINIPSTITTMGVASFRGCTGITDIQVNWTAAVDIPDATVSNLFNGLTLSGINLLVPTDTEAFYEAAAVWTDFNIQVGVLSANSIEKNLGFSIYPNPTSGVVSIKSKQLIDANVRVYDLNGRVLMSKSINGTLSEINMSNLASGMYLFKVQVGNSTFVKRIIKK